MKKHKWIMDEGEIDIFAYEQGTYHNGPECSVCGFGFCHHCYPKGYNTSCPSPSLSSSDSKLDSGIIGLVNSLKSKREE